MTKELREKIAALRAAAPVLNAATDRAGAVVQTVERLLSEELSLGVAVQGDLLNQSFVADEESEQEVEIRTYLAYDRFGGKFRILVRDESYDSDGDITNTNDRPWGSCERDTRLATFALLPALLGTIADKAVKMAERASGTSDVVEDMIAALPEEPTPKKARATPTIPVGLT